MKNIGTEISNETLALDLGLSKKEFERICTLLNRIPNINEISIFSAMWSEHCSYKSSKKWLKTLPSQGSQVIHGPGENAGAIDIGDGLAAIFKIESHNHPSFIEPFQGAATGVGGILRDIFTMGARPVALLNALRFGSPSNIKTPHLLNGVVSGIGGYGNCIGVPTIAGETNFDVSYDGNILVNAMAIGIAKKDKIFLSAAKGNGNPLIYVGAKTGRDGIHGATMASNEFHENTEQKRPTVQVGDPFTGKLLMEACLELMESDAVIAIQDMGAAGLTSSAVEMASKGNLGISIDMDKVPTREKGMTTFEIMLSESQERMLLVLKPDSMNKAKNIFEKWDLDFAVIGKITKTNKIELIKNASLVASIPLSPLVNEAPEYNREWEPSKCYPILKSKYLKSKKSISEVLLKMMGSQHLSSRKWVWEQYDSSVMGDTIAPPGGDAGIVRIHGSKKSLCASVDCTPRYVLADPFEGTRQAVAESYRNISAVGGLPLALTNNLNFGNPEKPKIMGQIVSSIKGMADASIKLNVPIVSGNVSLYNETSGKAIMPTPVIGVVGLLENNDLRASMIISNIGDDIFVIGQKQSTTDGWLGQSIYSNEMDSTNKIYAPPPVDLDLEILNGSFIRLIIQQQITQNVHDVSDGGLIVALAEMLLASPNRENLGLNIIVPETPNIHGFSFGEDQGRYIVITSSKKELIKKSLENNVDITYIGQVTNSKQLTFSTGDHIYISELMKVHDEWFNNLMS